MIAAASAAEERKWPGPYHDCRSKCGGEEENMIDYEEELKKFEPCLDVTDAEGAIYDREFTDILDVLQEVLREAKSGKRAR